MGLVCLRGGFTGLLGPAGPIWDWYAPVVSGRLPPSAVKVVPSRTAAVMLSPLQDVFALVLQASWWLHRGDDDGGFVTVVARASGRRVWWW